MFALDFISLFDHFRCWTLASAVMLVWHLFFILEYTQEQTIYLCLSLSAIIVDIYFFILIDKQIILFFFCLKRES